MKGSRKNDPDIMDRIRKLHGDKIHDFLIPPPVFEFMQGEFIDFDPHEQRLITRFPIKDEYLNPYKTMQGGLIVAAMDNTLGPLSMLVAPPNVTRNLEIKYNRPVRADQAYIEVQAKFLHRENRHLHFQAEVRSESGELIARGKAIHYVVNE